MKLFATYRPEFETFEEAMLQVLATALATPEFLYVTQRATNEGSASPAKISELELANRLAVFLWASIPDDELRTLAERGKLHEPDVLNAKSNAC